MSRHVMGNRYAYRKVKFANSKCDSSTHDAAGVTGKVGVTGHMRFDLHDILTVLLIFYFWYGFFVSVQLCNRCVCMSVTPDIEKS